MRTSIPIAVLVAAAALAGCTAPPEGIEPVGGFELDRYLGTWYEIARLDHPFERGLSHVTAEYSRRDDGLIRVVNRGYDTETGEWGEAEGVARPRGRADVASLEVSFFRPFWSGYHVIVLDGDYEHALVCGSNRSYLWILAREKHLPPAVLDDLRGEARRRGFAVDELIYPEQRTGHAQPPQANAELVMPQRGCCP